MLNDTIQGAFPGITQGKTTQHKRVSASDAYFATLPGGRLIDGTKTRDVTNAGNTGVILAGKIMGKVTASGKYANAIIGKTTLAIAASGTTLTVSAATAAEIVRRIGASGTLKLVGPPTAAGTVAVQSVTYSAVNTATGAITCTAVGAAAVTDSLVCDTDGSHLPVSFIYDGFGIRVTDGDGNSVDAQFSSNGNQGLPIGGTIDPTRFTDWPADASTQAWILAALNSVGNYIFVNNF